LQITHSTSGGRVVVALAGQITVASAPRIQRALLRDLAEGPLAIICDLRDVDALDPVCATIFATVANHPASRWPATSLLLCAAQPAVAEVLGGLGARHALPLYDSLQQALDAAADRRGYLRDELPLAATPTAATAARRFVRETLQSWQLAALDGELCEQAQVLAGELVTNAVVHAQTDMRLLLELGGDLLHVSVTDLDPRLPRLLRDDPQAEGGRGLRLVKWIATTWGAQPHPEGGKVVWCTLRTSPVQGPGMELQPNPMVQPTAAGNVANVLLYAAAARLVVHAVLDQQAEQLHARVDTMRADLLGASTLTAAEQRLLPLLATHLTFREIGGRLHVSFHTVKTQAMSIYRKLGVSSRSQAIAHAQELGLLPAS
jgi:DNA-binding CsgD family transcriptional regulator/anti-anti-sigma regulatory factor/anti-sigma regulatory factor (Ser/Thr protein kinase)